MTKNSESHKLDIFEVLRNIDVKNRDYYKSLTDEEKKALSPFVVMRWMTGIRDPRQIYYMNEFVNPFVFPLQKHKDLLLELMMVSTSGKKQRYKWMKQPKKKTSGQTKLVNLVKNYFGYNTKHAVDALPLLSNDDLMSYAEQLGYQKDEISAIKKEMKKR